MLHRIDGNDVIALSQPAHAWVSGQLAQAWGNATAGELQPRRDVILAAEQHDIAWLEWETAPTLNAETGLPHNFMTIPTSEHLGFWSSAGSLALAYGRYVALLVAGHGLGLYKRFHNWEKDTDEEAATARKYIAEVEQFAGKLRADLQQDPQLASLATDKMIDRNQALVGLWDGISLALCHGLTETREFEGVPAADGQITLTLQPTGDDQIEVDPWPFSTGSLTLICEGRRLSERFDDQDAMRKALASAPWERIEIILQPKSH